MAEQKNGPVLTEYLLRLATNSDALRAALHNPTKSLTDAGLSVDQRKAVLSGDSEIISAHVAAELLPLMQATVGKEPFTDGGVRVSFRLGYDHLQFMTPTVAADE
jgi:hypothetical protein